MRKLGSRSGDVERRRVPAEAQYAMLVLVKITVMIYFTSVKMFSQEF